MKKLLLCSIIAVMCTSCAKLYEDMDEQRIPRPRFDTEIPVNPPWDSVLQSESQTGK